MVYLYFSQISSYDVMNGFSLILGCCTEVVRTVVMKGKAPVDIECKAKLGKVLVSVPDMKLLIHIWSCWWFNTCRNIRLQFLLWTWNHLWFTTHDCVLLCFWMTGRFTAKAHATKSMTAVIDIYFQEICVLYKKYSVKKENKHFSWIMFLFPRLQNADRCSCLLLK